MRQSQTDYHGCSRARTAPLLETILKFKITCSQNIRQQYRRSVISKISRDTTAPNRSVFPSLSDRTYILLRHTNESTRRGKPYLLAVWVMPLSAHELTVSHGPWSTFSSWSSVDDHEIRILHPACPAHKVLKRHIVVSNQKSHSQDVTSLEYLPSVVSEEQHSFRTASCSSKAGETTP